MGWVLLNLFDNACYATHIKMKKIKDGYCPTLSVSTKVNNKSIIITVRDNGTGIAKEEINEVFLPFYTTKPTGSGTGLGLSISYDIVVNGHAGELSVKSETNHFTDFSIKLPKN